MKLEADLLMILKGFGLERGSLGEKRKVWVRRGEGLGEV